MCLAGTMPWVRAAFLVPAQIIASMCAGGLARCMFPGDLAVANSVLSSDTLIVRGLFIEMFFTAFLVFVVLMLSAERSKDTFIAPIGIGLALFVAMLAGKTPAEKPRILSHHLHADTLPVRDVLYRRITQSSSQFRMCRRDAKFPWL